MVLRPKPVLRTTSLVDSVWVLFSLCVRYVYLQQFYQFIYLLIQL